MSHSVHETAGAAVDYHLWVTGVSSAERILPAPHRAPSVAPAWEPLPQSWFDDYLIAGDTIEHSMRAQDNWHFSDVGQGAFTFDVKNAGGNLVIGLTGWNHSDLNGYYIVLDDDNHESYVLRLSAIGTSALLRERIAGPAGTGRRSYVRMPNVTADPTFRLNYDERMRFWVMYQHGTIVVGEGGALGQGRIILYMTPDARKVRNLATDLYHYGFARHGSRWKPAINVLNTQAYKYKHGAYFPLPPKPTPPTTANTSLSSNGVLYRA